jgi:hypothetical protein
MIDHDALFKILLKTCFIDFLELFFPEMCAYLDKGSVEFLDKEFFTGIASDKRREADLVVKAKFANREAFFLINLEGQPGERFFGATFLLFRASASGDPPANLFHCRLLRRQAEEAISSYLSNRIS